MRGIASVGGGINNATLSSRACNMFCETIIFVTDLRFISKMCATLSFTSLNKCGKVKTIQK